MAKNLTMAQAKLEQSTGRTCTLRGCTRKKYGITRWCKTHYSIQRRNGSPTQRAITEKDYLQELKEVEDVLSKNECHAGVISGTDLFKAWLEKASAGKDVPARKHLAICAEKGVTPMELLAVACAVFRYSHEHPKELPEGETLVFQIARNIFRKGRIKRKVKRLITGRIVYAEPTTVDLRAAGNYVLKTLTPLLMNIHHSIVRKYAEEDRKLQDLWSPLET